MALDDFLDPEVAIAVGLTAVVASPAARKVVRRGAVYGLAGLLVARDKLASVTNGVMEGARHAVASLEAGDGKQAPSETAAPPNPEVAPT